MGELQSCMLKDGKSNDTIRFEMGMLASWYSRETKQGHSTKFLQTDFCVGEVLLRTQNIVIA